MTQAKSNLELAKSILGTKHQIISKTYQSCWQKPKTMQSYFQFEKKSIPKDLVLK
jgi:hypothetical protein